jgi:tetratricopeptide (TPR) repeat protein/predicted Ser/Thr protein kinase
LRGPFGPIPSAPDTVEGELRDALVSSAERLRRVGREDPIAREVARAKLFGGDGPRIGRYRVDSMLGAGGMGVVYRAHDVELDRDVALKMLAGEDDDRRDARLHKEARALARLSHPNVVQVFDFGRAFGRFFIAMELVDGPTLRQWQRGRSTAEILRAYLDAGRGIAAAHAHGLLHLDLKPDNVLVGSDGRPRVADFGLVADGPTQERERGQSPGGTGTSSLAGTPEYMSPEQVRRDPLDERSDVFSFCVALRESITGTHPSVGGSTSAVPRSLRAALEKGLAIDPRQRFASMDALLDALDRRPRRGWIAAAAIAGVATTAASLRAADAASSPCEDVPATSAWNEDIDGRISARFVEVQPAWGASAWAALQPDLAAHAEEWVRAREETCGAEPPRTDALDCLARDRERFGVVLDHLATVDARAIERAAAVVEALPAPRGCLESASDAAPSTVDPRARATRVALDLRLANLRARIDIDRTAELDAETEALVREALAQPDPGVRARAWLARGVLLDRELLHAEAAAALEEAYFLATEAGLREDVLDAAVRLVHIHGVELGDPARGLEWAQHADAAIERMGLDPQRMWMLRAGRVTTLMKANRLEEAEAEARAALAAIAADPAREGVRGAEESLYEALGHVLVTRGRLPEAEAAFERAVAIARARRGDEHPFVGSALFNLATPLGAQGKAEASERALREAERLWTRAYGPDEPRMAVLLMNLANTIGRPPRTREALGLATRGLEIATKHGFPPVKMSEIHHTLGNLHQELREYDDAAKYYELERAAIEATLGPDDPELGHALHSLGRVNAKRGRHDEARSLYEQALAIWRAAYGDDHPLVSFPLHSLGELELELGHPEAALPHLREALALRLAHPGKPAKLAQTRFALARAVWASGGDRREAKALAAEARAVFADAGEAEAARLAEVDAWLSRPSAR